MEQTMVAADRISISYTTGFDILHDCRIPEGMVMMGVNDMVTRNRLDGDHAYFQSEDDARKFAAEHGYIIPYQKGTVK